MMYCNQFLMAMLRNLRTSSLCKKLLSVKQQLIQCHQFILQQEKSSLQEPFPSADNMDSRVSFTIPSALISGNSTTQPSLFHSLNTQTARNICDKCNCTYIISCLRCEQDENYQQSLTSDQNSDGDSSNIGLVSKFNDPDVDNVTPVADVRIAKLADFNRNSGLRLRYRHSIGPPSLSCATIDKKTTVESNK